MIYFTLHCEDLNTIQAFSEFMGNDGEDLRMIKDSGLRRLCNSKNKHEYKHQ